MTNVDSDTRNVQILTILIAENAVWSRCGGPGRRTGVTAEMLLLTLEQDHPLAGWDLEAVLDTLDLGLKTGIYRTLLDQYFMSAAMIFQNPANRRFQSLSKRICTPVFVSQWKPIV